ncbi:MAG: endo-1,4-beta-xylanase [Lentisphaeria bacterium]|nr:endo-1,4-beta-xylanase [Lentisphaeria bacterium]
MGMCEGAGVRDDLTMLLPRARCVMAGCLAFLVLAPSGRADEAVAEIDGYAARKIVGAEPNVPSHVIKTGKEILEWDLPDIPAGYYRIEMVVRTGNTGSNHLNLVHCYRVWTVDEAAAETERVGFHQKPGSTPVRGSDKWPVFVGEILSSSPLQLAPGKRLRVTAKVNWADVRKIRILPPEPEDLLSLELSTPKARHLFRRGEKMSVELRARSFLKETANLSVTVQLESPYGQVLAEKSTQLSVEPGGSEAVALHFTSAMNGCHIVSARGRWLTHEIRRELALGVVSVGEATQLPDDSPFAVHPGGLTEMYQSGFKWIRLWDTGDTWARHERAGKGQFDFSATEAKVDTFRRQGFRVLAVLGYTPSWASKHPEIGYHAGAGAPFPPRDVQDWRDYCREYMTRFKGRIQHFEVWNEPNTGSEANLERGFFRGTVPDYVALLKAAFEVSREVDPDIRILGCSGTGGFLGWTEAVLANGGGPFMDILSFHAYTTPKSPGEANLGGRLDRLHQIMQNHNVADLPIWNTEVGYWQDRRDGARPATPEQILAKAPPGLAPNWQTGWPYRPIAESDAAAFTVRHYYLNLSKGVSKLFWYSSITSGQPLLCRDSSLRLPCFAVASAAEQLQGFRYIRRVDLGLKRLHMHIWEGNGEAKAILWHAGRGTKEVVLEGVGTVRAVDIWGNGTGLSAAPEGILVQAGRDPITLVGKTRDFARARLRMHKLIVPVDNCRVVREVNPDRPVKNHTSPLYHGERRVFGLPDIGDTLGWRLQGIKAGFYRLELELRTGVKGALYQDLGWYEVTAVSGSRRAPVELLPTEAPDRKSRPMETAEGGGRAYGWARGQGPVWLAPGDEIHVALTGGFGFVGALMLSESGDERHVYSLTSQDQQVRLDGKLDEVRTLKPFPVSRRRQVVIGVADPFASISETDAWRGPEDLSADFWAICVPGHLYVAVAVRDSGGLFPATGGAFNGDCIELFLDLRPPEEVGDAVTGKGVYQLMLRAPKGETPQTLVQGRPAPGSSAIAVATPEGWIAEFLIPVDLPAGRTIGLDVALDDDDTGKGRKSQIVWHGTSQNFQDPSAYGRFRVIAPSASK